VAAARAVRVVTEVAALDRLYDWELTDKFAHVAVGDRVRVDLHGRSVRGWVWDIVDADRELKPLTKWLGLGVPHSMKPLIEWAAHRWYGPTARFLLAASPERIVTSLPTAPAKMPLDDAVRANAQMFAPGVVRLAPSIDPLALILGAYESTREQAGSLLVLVPTEAWARRLAGRLAQRGCAVALSHEWEKMRATWPVIVGSRGAAFAPCEKVCGAVIVDADDEAYRSEAAPTWFATDVLRFRCEAESAPWWATSPVPSPSLTFGAPNVTVAPDEFKQWPEVQIIDRRLSDPRDGALSSPALDAGHHALDGAEPVAVVVILQRLGAARLLACSRCGELARCELCGQAEIESDDQLMCAQHGITRALFCRSCGATKLRRVRSGVTTLARDVQLQLGQPVTELTSRTPLDVPMSRIVVGTEAIFHRIRRAGVVIFADFDQYLLAPRERARRDALSAVAHAARLCGSRREGRGRVVLQTRRSQDDVLSALTFGTIDDILRDDADVAQALALAPYGAVAQISGDGAQIFAEALANSDVAVSRIDDEWTARAKTTELLINRLAATPRPSGRLRVAVT
jgi:primosomal protein N' (replication factor Y)